jgi:hypothetical protein
MMLDRMYSGAMIDNARASRQPVPKLGGATIGILAALLMVLFGSSGIAQAATVPFTFELTYDVFVDGVPSLIAPTLPTRVSGSGSFAPFGGAI